MVSKALLIPIVLLASPLGAQDLAELVDFYQDSRIDPPNALELEGFAEDEINRVASPLADDDSPYCPRKRWTSLCYRLSLSGFGGRSEWEFEEPARTDKPKLAGPKNQGGMLQLVDHLPFDHVRRYRILIQEQSLKPRSDSDTLDLSTVRTHEASAQWLWQAELGFLFGPGFRWVESVYLLPDGGSELAVVTGSQVGPTLVLGYDAGLLGRGFFAELMVGYLFPGSTDILRLKHGSTVKLDLGYRWSFLQLWLEGEQRLLASKEVKQIHLQYGGGVGLAYEI